MWICEICPTEIGKHISFCNYADLGTKHLVFDIYLRAMKQP